MNASGRLLAKLQPFAHANDFKLFRSPAVALVREEATALVVFPEEESVDAAKNVLVDRRLVMRVLAVAREPLSDETSMLSLRVGQDCMQTQMG